jgi:hypothetical protein
VDWDGIHELIGADARLQVAIVSPVRSPERPILKNPPQLV